MSEESNVPWVEKYRPQRIDDIVQQDEVVSALRSTLASGDLPHLIFHGPPGSGKTSTALALCRALFDGKDYRRRVMELNASDDRGIDSVRTKIKQFAALSVPAGRVPYKIVILDEADSMTRDAQSALRRIIENYSSVTRFIIICNYVSKIIDPILSRCARFRFRALGADSVVARLRDICEREGVAVESDGALRLLVGISGGDMRRAITFLQSAAAAGAVSEALVRELSGAPDPSLIERFMSACAGFSTKEIEDAAADIAQSGYDVAQALELLCDAIAKTQMVPDTAKPELEMRVSAANEMIANRADPYLQLLAVGAAINAAKQ